MFMLDVENRQLDPVPASGFNEQPPNSILDGRQHAPRSSRDFPIRQALRELFQDSSVRRGE
jgi:hypothetical protein